jgi:hypothetical protein
MCKLALLTAIVLLSVLSGTSWAGQTECKPLCALTASSQSNSDHKEGDHRVRGQRDADNVGSEHGSIGRDNAQQKHDAHRRRDPGVSAPASGSTSLSVPTLDPNKMDSRAIAPTCSLC